MTARVIQGLSYRQAVDQSTRWTRQRPIQKEAVLTEDLFLPLYVYDTTMQVQSELSNMIVSWSYIVCH